MKLLILLFFASLLTWVSAFSEPGAYERLWYWYAYTLDSSHSKVAPDCRGSEPGKRCTFEQFMKYIDEKPLERPPLPKNVDPLDIPRAVAALKGSQYTGLYNCKRIYVDIKGKNDVAKLMRAITGFLAGNIDGADDRTKTALQQVTKAVAALRTTASLPDLTESLKKKGITAVTGPYQYMSGSDDTTEFLDFRATARTNEVKASTITEYVEEWREADPGHSENIKAAREGASTMAEACVAGPS